MPQRARPRTFRNEGKSFIISALLPPARPRYLPVLSGREPSGNVLHNVRRFSAVLCALNRGHVSSLLSALRSGLAGKTPMAPLASHILVVDPAVSLLKPYPQRDTRLPVKMLSDARIVAVSAVHALWRAEIVVTL